MKRILSLLFCFLFFILTPCKANAATNVQTVMVYMIGSNLEAGFGSASEDLEEMAAALSGNAAVQLVVYAGGSTQWHTWMTEKTSGVYTFEDGAWRCASSLPSEDMGEASTLSNFLTYTYANFPASSFSLILWDHGAGPMEGFGMDQNLLSLFEVKQALEASPFSKDNPLMMIGFDACYMNSIETAYMVSDYADYMIASQEAEPNQGWNYSFLSQITPQTSGKVLGKMIIDAYTSYYQAIYQDHPEYLPDHSLSCLALEHVGEVETAFNALGRQMSAHLKDDGFIPIASIRQMLPGIGEFTRNYPYDLIDMYSFAKLSAQYYPLQSQALCQALEKLTVENRSNVQDLHGVSAYFLLKNKSSFNSSWKKSYKDMQFSEDYYQFLLGFSRIFQGKSLFNQFEGLKIQYDPSLNKFTVPLLPDQSEGIASAKLYILERVEGEQFRVILSGDDAAITEQGLSAVYSHQALFCSSSIDPAEKGILNFKVVESNDEVIKCHVSALLNFYETGHALDLDNINVYATYQLLIFKKSGQVVIQGLVPQTAEDAVAIGKQQIDTKDVDAVEFLYRTYYKESNPDGTLKPFSQWPPAQTLYGYEYSDLKNKNADVVFSIQDISDYNRELYAMFVITDLQQNTYTSDMVLFHQPTIDKEQDIQPENTVHVCHVDDVSQFDPITLMNQNDIEIQLVSVNHNPNSYAKWNLLAINHSDQFVNLHLEDTTLNDYMLYLSLNDTIDDFSVFFDGFVLPPKETKQVTIAVRIEDISDVMQNYISSIEFSFRVVETEDANSYFKSDRIRIEAFRDLQDYIALPAATQSNRLQSAPVFDSPVIRATPLFTHVSKYFSTLETSIIVENLTDETITITDSKASLNGFMLHGSLLHSNDILPRKKIMGKLSISEDDYERLGAPPEHEIEFCYLVRSMPSYEVLLESDTQQFSFILQSTQAYSQKLLYSSDDISIHIQKIDSLIPGSDQEYTLMIENDSDESIELELNDIYINDISAGRCGHIWSSYTCPQKKNICTLRIDHDALQAFDDTEISSVQIQLLIIAADFDMLIENAGLIALPEV